MSNIEQVVLRNILTHEIINASNINSPITILGDAPMALQIAISRLLSFKLESTIAAIPIKVVKITTNDIPNNIFVLFTYHPIKFVELSLIHISEPTRLLSI